MSKTLDFTKAKKEYFTIILDDGKDTKLRVTTPSKELSEAIDFIYDPAFNEQESSVQYERLYDLVTAILNHNKDGKKITREDVESCLDDIVDMWTLLNMYREFIYEQMQAQAKN